MTAATRLTATYRLQVHKGFSLAQAREIVPYLARLGISHAYTSPILAARPGSTHGYDVADPTRVNPELGGDEARLALVRALREHGMGFVLDIVPNHMGTGPANPMWEDVLAHGRGSRYAKWFDIDWEDPSADFRGKVMVPILGDRLEKVIERDELSLVRQGGAVRLAYFDHTFPLDPATTADLPQRLDDWAKGPDGRERLRALLRRQHYRLAFWRRAAEEIDYRRFFDINELIALRQEDAEVFTETHALVLGWIADGTLDGLRVDHVDGILDPLAYLERLRAEVTRRRPGAEVPVFVEKILSPGEHLRLEWPVQGTTGYEFLNDLEALFLDPAGMARIEAGYRKALRLPGEMTFAAVAHRGKREVLRNAFAADVSRLVRRLKAAVPEAVRRHELDARALGAAIVELIAALPVYRSYVDARRGVHPDDRRVIKRAIERAHARDEAPRAAVDVAGGALLRDERGDAGRILAFTQRFQQTSGPATAKGVEDTALYRWVPLASRNEVGGEPDRDLATAVDQLHRANAERAEAWPLALVCTNTHDTKRSADVRARIDVLTEEPEEWLRLFDRWHRANASLRGRSGRRSAPDASAEWLLYQTLVGVWPLGGEGVPPREELDALCERVQKYMEKASREAKTRTKWTEPDVAWEKGVMGFIAAILDPARSGDFLHELSAFARSIARPGMWNALARALVHCTAPGTPDVYQGDELWNFALVDPDNRRPVDFAERARALDELDALFAARGGPAASAELLASPEDGRIKLHVMTSALRLRRRLGRLFGGGRYVPLVAEGARAAHLFAFARADDEGTVIVAVPRLTVSLSAGAAPVRGAWGDTQLRLPPELRDAHFTDALSGAAVRASGGAIRAAELFAHLPVALLAPAAAVVGSPGGQQRGRG